MIYAFEDECICPIECDCENPPPDDWDGKNGTYHISMFCPIHNKNPMQSDDCQAEKHKNQTGEFNKKIFFV